MATKEQRKKNEQDIVDFFNRRWTEITNVIEFNPEWQKPTRCESAPTHLDDAVTHPDFTSLPIGVLVKSMDDNGRRLIAVNTRMGVAIVYRHGSDVRPWYDARLLALPRLILAILRNPIELAEIVGGVLYHHEGEPGIEYENLGTTLENVYRIMNGGGVWPNT